MPNRFSQYCYSICRQVAQELRQFASVARARLAGTPLPAAAVWLLGLMLLIVLIPLLLGLFLALVILRILLGLLSQQNSSQRSVQRRDVIE